MVQIAPCWPTTRPSTGSSARTSTASTGGVYLDTLSMARAAHGHHMRHDLDTIAKAHGLAGKVKRDALADTKGKQQLTDKEERALGAYCVDDVEDTYKIFWKLFDYIPDDELRLIDMTQRMFCDPILRIDIPRVQAELEKEIGSKAAALLRSGASVEDPHVQREVRTLAPSGRCTASAEDQPVDRQADLRLRQV